MSKCASMKSREFGIGDGYRVSGISFLFFFSFFSPPILVLVFIRVEDEKMKTL